MWREGPPHFLCTQPDSYSCPPTLMRIKLPHLCVLLSPADAVRKIFIELANSSFAGFPNLIKIAKVIIIVILIFEILHDRM